MKRKIIQRMMAGMISAALIGSMAACGTDTQTSRKPGSVKINDDAAEEKAASTEVEDEGAEELTLLERPVFFQTAALSDASAVKACVPEYSVEDDLANITNAGQFYFSDEQKQMLRDNLFYIVGEFGSHEFYERYEMNRYDQKASFVTVDSLMHTYHLYFSYLLQNIEKEYLSDNLSKLSKAMLEQSKEQYEALKGTEWEEAAKTNLAFFTVGAYLQDSSVSIPSGVKETVEEELARIYAQDAIAESLITKENEDYTQYAPRGYYEGDTVLENYFRAMMWYGRTAFTQSEEKNDRSALLITLALRDGELAAWEEAYAVTSFFAGASDDLGYCEYLPVIEAAYGKGITVENLAGKDSEWETFHKLTQTLRAPAINSIPVEDSGEEEQTIASFRFMGQRFSVDAAIMQNLVYSKVGKNAEGGKRMLPDVLDVAAAFGNEAAEAILEQQGDMEYSGFQENLEKLQEAVSSAPDTLWTASLYAGWLHTLAPLLENQPEGYPAYTQSKNWKLKNLETFAGSYAELKHDTILYSKQIMTEMGGGDEETFDDRGYVDPQPEVYTRFAALADATIEGLKTYGILETKQKENLELLKELAQSLEEISKKELRDETLSDEEYELIRNYGGNLEHFWEDAMRGLTGEEDIYVADYPAALVADIATDPNGQVLEVGTGSAEDIYVVVPVDGELKIAVGSVYSFYEFAWPMDDRLTDNKWRQMMGMELNDNEEYDRSNAISQPEWATSYRYYYEY